MRNLITNEFKGYVIPKEIDELFKVKLSNQFKELYFCDQCGHQKSYKDTECLRCQELSKK